jgi:hypothetical protein
MKLVMEVANHVNGLSEGFKHNLVKDRCLITEVA